MNNLCNQVKIISGEIEVKRIMLVLSTMRQSPKEIEYALQTAKKENAELVALFIIDSNMPGTVFQRLHEMDLIGEKPSEELSKALMGEYRQRGYEKLEEVEKKAKGKNVHCSIYIEEGDFAEEVLKMINKLGVSLVILTRSRRSNISRMFFGSAVDELIKQSPCEVKIVDEDKI